MATQVQFRGGTTSEHSSFNGVAKEITVDTTKQTLVVQDGSTNGGFPLLREKNPDNQKVYFGTGDDLQIYHDGTNSNLYNATGEFKIRGTDVRIMNSAGNEHYFYGAANSYSALYYDNSKKLETTSGGINVDGSVTADDIITAGALLHEGDSDTLVHFSAADTIDLKTGNVVRLTVNNSGVNLGANLYSAGKNISVGDSSGSTDDRLQFGDSQDLQIYHDGSHSNINNSTGNFRLQCDHFRLNSQDNNENLIYADKDGGVELYYDGSKKLETASDKITFHAHAKVNADDTYDLGASGARWKNLYLSNDIYIKDNGELRLGDSGDLQLYHNGSHSYINDTGTGDLNIISNTLQISNSANTEFLARFVENAEVQLYYDNVKRFETLSTGAKVTGSLGVGTTPDTEFHVKGGGTVAKFEGTGGSGFISLFDSDDSTQVFVGGDGGTFKVQTSGNSWSDKFTVDATGTSSFFGTPKIRAGNALELYNGFDDQKARIQNAAGSNYSNLIFKVVHNGTESTALTMDPDGNCDFAKQIKVAAGYGIHFGANSDGSRAVGSNVLDEYEEGTWTPTLTGGGGGSDSWSTKEGTYTRIGNMVTCRFNLRNYQVGSTLSGDITCGGLPFTNLVHHYVGDFGIYNMDLPAGATGGTMMFINTNTGNWYIYWDIDDGNSTLLNSAHFNTGTYIQGNISYRVA